MARHSIPGIIRSLVFLMACAVLVSCGGNSSSFPSQPTPNIAGAWEFVAVSNSGSVTGIEVSLSEGSVLVNGVSEPNGQVTATSNQISFVSLSPTTLNITGFGGTCQPVSTDRALTGSVTAIDSPFQFSFTENGNVFSVTGTLGGDGKSLLNGTYTAQAGNGCAADTGGTITGLAVSKISGTYAGQMCALSDTSSPCQLVDTATAVASENSSSNLTLTLNLTGTDNTSFTLTGPVTGNAFTLQGTIQGQPVIYQGYYEPVKNIPSLYLVNSTNPVAPNYVGTLAVPQP